MLVLTGRGHELEHEWAFGVVRQLLEPVLARMADDGQPPAGAAARAVDLLGLPGASAQHEPAGSSQEASFAVLHGLYWLCAGLAERQPVCLVLDDLQWMDPASLRFLAFLLPRLEELAICVLAAQRPPFDAEEDRARLALVNDPATQLVRIGPLGEQAIAALLAEDSPGEPDRELVGAVRAATGGVPFLVLELREILHRSGGEPTAASVARVEREGARSVGQWMATRLGELSPGADAVARALAVLEEADTRLVAALAGVPVAAAARATDDLVGAGLLAPGQPLRFAHPLLRAGIYALHAPRERSAMHRRAAELLDADPGGHERAGEHLLVTTPAGDGWVVSRLVALAEQAAAAGGTESAVTYLVRALAEPPAAELRAGVLLALGVAEGDDGRATAVERLRQSFEAATEPAERLTACLTLALVLGQQSRYVEALDPLEEAVEMLRADADAVRAVEALAAGVAMLDAATAPRWKARLRVARDRGDEPSHATRDELAVAGLLATMAGEPATTGAGLARAAIAAGEQPWPERQDGPWFAQACATLVWAECFDEALRALNPAIVRLRERGETRTLSGALSHRAWLHLLRGDLLSAEADARTCLEVSVRMPAGLYHVLAVALAVDALTEQDELPAAEALLELVPGSAEGGSTTDAVLRLRRARLRLAQGRPDPALADALAAGELAMTIGLSGPCWLAWRSEAALAHLARGDREAALVLATEELELATTFGAPRGRSVALRATALATGGERGRELLREAVAVAGGHAPLERTRALVDLGAAELEAGDRGRARELLSAALDQAHRRHATALEARARQRLKHAGGRPRRAVQSGFDALTASERRVAELAAQGHTNREIGEALFVTARTVEGHLTRAFAKLGVTSREHLGDALPAASA